MDAFKLENRIASYTLMTSPIHLSVTHKRFPCLYTPLIYIGILVFIQTYIQRTVPLEDPCGTVRNEKTLLLAEARLDLYRVLSKHANHDNVSC